MLTPDLLFELKEIVRTHHLAFIAKAFGTAALPDPVVAFLKAKGLIDDVAVSAEDAYLYGAVLSAFPEAKAWTPEQFKSHLAAQPIALTKPEKAALVAAQMSAGNFVVGLGNVVEKETGMILVEADAELREKLQNDIGNAVKDSIAFRQSASTTKSALGHATQDWTRDLDRIVRTEKHSAMSVGTVEAIKAKHGAEARVAVQPSGDACDACKKLYLGPDGHPRIFPASMLVPMANVGKKKSAWVASLPPLHPHCQCFVIRVPTGWGFNKDGNLAPGATGGVAYDDAMTLQKAFIREEAFVDGVRKAARKLHDRCTFRGLKISIENGLGTERTWIDHDGTTGSTPMMLPYGYIRMTEGVDGDHVDVFVGPHEHAPFVYVVHTRKKLPEGGFGGYDEDKVFLGLGSAGDAEAAFRNHYNDPGFFGGMSTLPFDEFKSKVLATLRTPASLTAVPTTVVVKSQTTPSLQSGNAPAGGYGMSALGGGPVMPTYQPADVSGHRAFLEAAAEGPGPSGSMFRDKSIYEAEHVDDQTWEGMLSTIAYGPTTAHEPPDDEAVALARDVVLRAANQIHTEPDPVRKSRPQRVRVAVVTEESP